MNIEMRPVGSISLKDRVRGQLGDLSDLMESMRDHGLINPITIKPDGTLIAGARRLETAKRLGWTEIASHVAKAETLADVLALEIEENTCRVQLTLAEAERARQHWRQVLGVKEGRERDRDAEGNFMASRQPEGGAPSGQTLGEMADAAVGYGKRTLQHVRLVRETAEDETAPEEAREVAKQEMARLETATTGAQPAAERVRAARKRGENLAEQRAEQEARTRAVMAPGQWLKKDEPKAIKPSDLPTRLWEVINKSFGSDLLVKITEEMEVTSDTRNLSTNDLTSMIDLLQQQIAARQRLRKALILIKGSRQ
jgi:ParB family transcriptional regulator, chromosome partitioning protein